MSNDPTRPDYDRTPEGALSDAERAVLEKLGNFAVVMRDVAARFGADEQWTRYASVSTVVEEVLANGWEDAGAVTSTHGDEGDQDDQDGDQAAQTTGGNASDADSATVIRLPVDPEGI